jgi:DNA-binding transcriptional LysR family regulator
MANMSRVDLNLLVVLEAIYAQGGVSRAAEKLNLTQPAISHALARLRELFGDQLFLRDGRGLAPTPLTRNLIEPLRRSLTSLGAVLDSAGRFDAQQTQAQFTVAMGDPAQVIALPRLMRRIVVDAPLIDLSIVQLRRRTIEAALAAGTLDLAIDVLLPVSEQVRRQRLSADRLVVVARSAHPKIRSGFTLATYLAQSHVMVTSRRRGPGLEDIALSQRDLRRRIRLRCRSYVAAFHVVRETDIVLTMAERYARTLNADFNNKIVRFPIEVPTLDTYLYWHASADDDPANRWLRGLVSKAWTK